MQETLQKRNWMVQAEIDVLKMDHAKEKETRRTELQTWKEKVCHLGHSRG